jgi:hypothetical protein
MTIRFAAAASVVSTHLDGSGARRGTRNAANDNRWASVIDCRLEAALRHFAHHGCGAAQDAGARARAAYLSGNGTDYRRWLDVCRQIDGRLARQLERLDED